MNGRGSTDTLAHSGTPLCSYTHADTHTVKSQPPESSHTKAKELKGWMLGVLSIYQLVLFTDLLIGYWIIIELILDSHKVKGKNIGPLVHLHRSHSEEKEKIRGGFKGNACF